MTTLATRTRRLLARRPALRLWYVALIFLWALTFGGIALLGAQMMQCAPSGCDTLGQIIHILHTMNAEFWPPTGPAGAFFLLSFWSPVILAPLGLTRPDTQELY
jgi:hypothetical protein